MMSGRWFRTAPRATARCRCRRCRTGRPGYPADPWSLSASISPCGIENGLCEKSTGCLLVVLDTSGSRRSSRSRTGPRRPGPARSRPWCAPGRRTCRRRSDRRRRRTPRRRPSGPAGRGCLGPLGADVLGDRAGGAVLAFAPEDVAEARLALALRPSRSCGRRRRGSRRPARGWPRSPSSARPGCRANTPKPPPRKWSETSCITSGLRRSGLSVPYFSIASR